MGIGQELGQHKVIDQQSAKQNQAQFSHLYASPYFTFMPGSAPLSGDSKKMSEPPGPAASTMPSDTPKRIFAGGKIRHEHGESAH